MRKKQESKSAPGSAQVPPRFLERMRDLLGAEYPQFAAIYAQPATHGLRVNTLKLSPKQFLTISPFPLAPIPCSPTGFLIPEESRSGKHPYHAAGLYYLQDPHAQAVAEILAPQPGERVLDIAASPGGKTTHIASRMQNQGVLVANEIKTKRIGHLAANLERWGAHNVAITNETPERLADFFGAFFDRVLVDAPCSGEGMFRKDQTARLDWSEEMIAGCAVRQGAILNFAARLVRPGGWLCYSTCTFAPEEDENVVTRFLAEHLEFEAQAYERMHVPLNTSIERTPPAPVGIRLWPHHSPGEGHFIALLRRTRVRTEAPSTPTKRFIKSRPAPAWDAWCSENLSHPLDEVFPAQIGSRLYALSAELPDLTGLRVFHPGWWLGNMKKEHFGTMQSGRFEPSHALAMGLQASDVQRIIVLSPDSPEILKYLRGEMLPDPGENGWVLITVAASPPPATPTDNPGFASPFSLGWGKRVHGVLKNHYPRGLLWI